MDINWKKIAPLSVASVFTLQYFLGTILVLPSTEITEGYLNLSYWVSFLDFVIFGLIGLIITWGLFLFKKDIWKYFFTVVIVISFTPWLGFSNMSWYVGINSLSVDVFGMGLLVSHLYFNKDILEPIRGFFRTSEKELKGIEEMKVRQFENRTHVFEKKFAKKTVKDLERIVTEKELIPEAIHAAERLLREKNGDNNS